MEPLDPNWVFPPGDVVTCGNRTWLFKKQRRHAWRDAGQDMRRDIMTGNFRFCNVKICISCGKDEDIRV